MSFGIRYLIDRLFPTDYGPRVLIGGLDYSGKTTLLYLLRLGEIVTTIPSMGLNVENVEVPILSGKKFKLTGWDVGGGCAGPRQMRSMLRFYTPFSEALIWVVDSCDKERLAESVQHLSDVLSDIDHQQKDSPKTIPVLILASKGDKSESMPLDDVRIAFSKAISGRLAAVYKTKAILDGPTGFPEAFDWLNIAVEISKSIKPSEPITSADLPNARSASTLAQKLGFWLHRLESDSSPTDFLTQFESISLPAWDHYTHIRLAYIILTTYDRQQGKDIIFTGIERYITQSPETKGRSFHFTMTYFWIQIVHFGIRNMPPPPDILPSEVYRPLPDDFARFLLINPHVADGNLWSDYYSKDVLMSSKAKAEMVLPDKKPLPSLVIRDAIKSFGSK